MKSAWNENDVIRHPAFDKSQPLIGARREQPAAALRHQLNAALHHSRALAHDPALLVLRIGDFRVLSERFGKSYAKKLSTAVENNLNNCLSHTDLVRKLGDDEFVIVLAGLKNVADICNMAQILIDACSGHYELGELTPATKIAAGIALFLTDADQSEELLRLARIALHQSGTHQKGYQFFSRELPDHQENNVWMETAMERSA